MAQLKVESKRLNVPVAEFIRQTLEDRLRSRRSAEARRDPFACITNLSDSQETDLASRVDEILYGCGSS